MLTVPTEMSYVRVEVAQRRLSDRIRTLKGRRQVGVGQEDEKVNDAVTERRLSAMEADVVAIREMVDRLHRAVAEGRLVLRPSRSPEPEVDPRYF